MSRCHYIDLGMDSTSDKFLRINQIVRDGMLKEYGFSKEFEKEMQQTLQNFDIRLPVDVNSALNSNNLQTDFIKDFICHFNSSYC